MTGEADTRQLLRRLWAHVGPHRRVHLAGFVLLVAASAVAEVMSLGLVIPFLAVLSDPAGIQQYEWAQPLLGLLQIDRPDELLLPLTVGFCALACLSAGVRFALVWAQTRLGEGIGNDLGEQAFRRTLHQPYLVHVGRNSSEVVSALMNKTDTAVYYVLIPLLTLAGSAVTAAAIIAFMLWASPRLTAGAFVILGGAYAGMVGFNRSRIAADGRRVTEGQTRIAQVVQEGLGGIREVLLGGLQPYFVRRFRDADRSLRHAIGTIAILGNAPRYVVDALTVVTVGAVVFHAARGPGGLDAAIPTLGALALAIQRLLPMAQTAYFASTAVQGGRASLGDLLALLDQPLPDGDGDAGAPAMEFGRALEFRNVTFRYTDNGRPVLAGASVSIPHGGRVGVIGETGSGKSTFLDLAMGLILPGSGEVLVDGVALNERNVRSWQTRVAHVPQHIFLTDASIAENIAFGAEDAEIDMDRVRASARLAQLEDVILTWPEQYATRVGERGVQLSGGQRQRVGIARALYRKADLLVLDEATSALDDATEDALVGALEGLGRSVTVLTVAHRKRSLRGCDFVLEIGRDGTVRRLEGAAASNVP
jgi:ATP-binding cassette subfamily B protein